MNTSERELFYKSKLPVLRKRWLKPDRVRGKTWEFDGVAYPTNHWMGYNHEMRKGLQAFGCTTFDELALFLERKLNRKPHVVDLMGGAYFLHFPEFAESLWGIRVHDKDKEYLTLSLEVENDPVKLVRESARLYRKIISATNRQIIEADILTDEGWEIIRTGKIPSADLLVCRPVGPFDVKNAMVNRLDDPATYTDLYLSLFQNMLELVNKKCGIVFIEVPDVYCDTDMISFVQYLNQAVGLISQLFTVPDKDYRWGGVRRRYLVIRFGDSMGWTRGEK